MTSNAVEQGMIEFRKAAETDKPYLLELRKLTMGEHIERAGLGSSDVGHMQRVEYRFETAQLVYVNEQRIGMIKYFPEGDVVKILQVQVHPDFQGGGFGEHIVRRVQEDAAAGNRRVFLTVLKENPARRLYERLGFRTVGEDEYEFHMLWQGSSD